MADTKNSKAPEPVGLYAYSKRVGNLIFLSGIGPRERNKKEMRKSTLQFFFPVCVLQ